MSEKNETDLTNSQESSKDRVGDIIRKERITRRITVETIAKDLKLNVKYIKSLEASEYEALPADPYVRVYLRSLAKYLSLDPEEILKKFYEERGLNIEHLKRDNSAKIPISMKEKEVQKSPMLAITVGLILVLVVISFIANKKGWISAPQQTALKTDSLMATPAGSKADSLTDSLLDDSLFSGAPVQVADTETIKKTDTVQTAQKKDDKKELKIRIEVSTDSVWAQVFSDGQSWKSIILKDQPREFTAKDSFNIHVGNNAAVKYTFNGKPLKIKGNGIVFFKIDGTGIPVAWGYTKWNNIFKDRL